MTTRTTLSPAYSTFLDLLKLVPDVNCEVDYDLHAASLSVFITSSDDDVMILGLRSPADALDADGENVWQTQLEAEDGDIIDTAHPTPYLTEAVANARALLHDNVTGYCD